MSEEPAQETGAAPRQGAGNSTAPTGQDEQGRPAPGEQARPPGPPGPTRPGGQADHGGRRALWLGGLAIVLTLFFAPFGVIAAIAALVVGVRARRRARQDHALAPGAVAGILLGSIGLALSVFSLAVTVFLWPEMNGYQQCLNGANTNTDKQSCQYTWFPKIEDKLHMPRGSMSRYGNLF